MMNLAVSTNPASIVIPPVPPPHNEQGDQFAAADHSEQGSVAPAATVAAPPHSEQGDLAVGRIGTAGMRSTQAALLAGARGGGVRAGNAADAAGLAAGARRLMLSSSVLGATGALAGNTRSDALLG